MDVFDAMSTCRAMRYLRPDPVDDALIEQIVTAASWAPSPGNSQARDFVIIKDPALKAKIGAAVEAAIAPVIADLDAPDRTHERMHAGTKHLLATLATCPVLILICGKVVFPYHAPREAAVWSTIYPAAQNLIVAARALGLGTVFTGFHGPADAVIRELVEIPDDVIIGCLIPVGWPARPFGPLRRFGYDSIIHVDRWRGDLRLYPPANGRRMPDRDRL